MILRQLRRLTAGAWRPPPLAAGAARSEAGTQILVQEVQLDSSGAVTGTIGSQVAFTGPTTLGQFAIESISPNLKSFVGGSVNTNASGPGDFFSLTTNVNASTATSAFDPSIGLQVVVTVDGLQPLTADQSGSLGNNAGASSGLNGNNIISNQSQLLTSASAPLGAASTVATDARPGPAPAGTSNISPSVALASIPDGFGIQQTILVRAEQQQGPIVGTLGGTASTTVNINSAAVPAPAGVVLALAAVPVLGLRRVFRRKPVA